MGKVIDHLWNWGHLEGSHNTTWGFNCSMSPEEFAVQYGIQNSFIVSFGGNIQPPYDLLAKRMSSLNEIKWSVIGDASTPLPDSELANTNDVIQVAKATENITGGIVDDFFSPSRIERFTPTVLSEMHTALNAQGLDFWCVLYAHELDDRLIPYLDCFDGITFWIWDCADICHMEEYYKTLKEYTKGKRIMLGVYLYNYCTGVLMDETLFRKQLTWYFNMLENGEIEGIVVCSNVIGDADLQTNQILKEYIKQYGQREIQND